MSPTVSPSVSPTLSPSVSPTATSTATPTPTSTPIQYGDANRNGDITNIDILFCDLMVRGTRDFAPSADANISGTITNIDILFIDLIVRALRSADNIDQNVYDFSTGAGTDRWAKSNNVAAPPPGLSDTFDTDPTGWVNATSNDYTNVSSEDGVVWSIAGASGNYTALQCKFTVAEGAYSGNVTSIGVTFNGTSEQSSDLLQLWAWNFNSGSWQKIDTDISLGNASSQGYTRWAEWGKLYGDYINGGNHVYILYGHNTSDRDLNADYVKLEITAPE